MESLRWISWGVGGATNAICVNDLGEETFVQALPTWIHRVKPKSKELCTRKKANPVSCCVGHDREVVVARYRMWRDHTGPIKGLSHYIQRCLSSNIQIYLLTVNEELKGRLDVTLNSNRLLLVVSEHYSRGCCLVTLEPALGDGHQASFFQSQPPHPTYTICLKLNLTRRLSSSR